MTERGRGAGGVTLKLRSEAVEVRSERVEADEGEEEIEGRETPMNRFVLWRRGKFSSNGESVNDFEISPQEHARRKLVELPLASDAITTASAKTTNTVSSEERDRCGVESGRGSGRYRAKRTAQLWNLSR